MIASSSNSIDASTCRRLDNDQRCSKEGDGFERHRKSSNLKPLFDEHQSNVRNCDQDNDNWAPKFKHPSNAPRQLIDKIRELVLAEHKKLDASEQKRREHDLRRLMMDNWLISRFYFKAQKEFEKNKSVSDGQETRLDLIDRTVKLILKTGDFRRKYRLCITLKDCDFPLEWLMIGGLISGEPDLSGNPVYYMRLRLHRPNLLTDQEVKHQFRRYFLYVLDRADIALTNKTGKALALVFDFGGVSYENYDLQTMSWIIRKSKELGPKLQAYTVIYNLPWIFNAPFKIMSSALITGSNRDRLEFAQGSQILHYIAWHNLPAYLQKLLHSSREQL